jgi:hypothetical protein
MVGDRLTTPQPERMERRPTDRSTLVVVSPSCRWPSWAASLIIHAALFLLLGWLWQPFSRGTGAERDRPIGIAIVHQRQGTAEYFLEAGGGGAAAASTETSLSGEARQAIQAAVAAVPDQGAITTEELLGEFAATIPSGLGKAAEMGNQGAGLGRGASAGVGDGVGESAKTTTRVFGLEGAGNSFVYVFDRSDSMNGFRGAPLRLAKRELSHSLSTLTSVNQFQIIFYNEAPSPYRGSLSKSASLIFATDTEKAAAERYVQGIEGAGGTEHLPALRSAVNLNADVIFFLTDAAEPTPGQGEIASIADKCLGRRTTLHSIEFGTGPAGDGVRWIEQLAKRTGGQYRYVDVTQLER